MGLYRNHEIMAKNEKKKKIANRIWNMKTFMFYEKYVVHAIYIYLDRNGSTRKTFGFMKYTLHEGLHCPNNPIYNTKRLH